MEKKIHNFSLYGRIEEGYFEYGNLEKQSGELKAKWGIKSKVGTKS